MPEYKFGTGNVCSQAGVCGYSSVGHLFFGLCAIAAGDNGRCKLHTRGISRQEILEDIEDLDLLKRSDVCPNVDTENFPDDAIAEALGLEPSGDGVVGGH